MKTLTFSPPVVLLLSIVAFKKGGEVNFLPSNPPEQPKSKIAERTGPNVDSSGLLPAENNARVRGTTFSQSSIRRRVERSLIGCKDCGFDTSIERFLTGGRNPYMSNIPPQRLKRDDHKKSTSVQQTQSSAYAFTNPHQEGERLVETGHARIFEPNPSAPSRNEGTSLPPGFESTNPEWKNIKQAEHSEKVDLDLTLSLGPSHSQNLSHAEEMDLDLTLSLGPSHSGSSKKSEKTKNRIFRSYQLNE